MRKKDTNILRRGRLITAGNRGDGPVVYWMERDMRLKDNWALLYAQQEALIRKKSLQIVYCLEPEVDTWRHNQRNFLYGGLQDLTVAAENLNIGFSIIRGKSKEILPQLITQADAHLLVTDFSPLRSKQRTLKHLSDSISTPTVEVDGHNVVPVWTTSDKREYAAYTIRPKLKRLIPDFLTDFPQLEKHPFHPEKILNNKYSLLQDFTFKEVPGTAIPPGSSAASHFLNSFIKNGLEKYDKDRNNPNLKGQSDLSPYLHFGQLSAQRAAIQVQKADIGEEAKEVFLEELIVRRELADNFCLYEQDYDKFRAFPNWAQASLTEHREDQREYAYTLEHLESCATHESLWNSCQRNLIQSGKLHGFLRMYWAKKILEWTASPEQALEICIYLNDTYSLDGRDPNGYTGIAWSVGGVHDRAWPERKIFGKVRYMNERGCRRKFNVDEYIAANDVKQRQLR